VGEPINPEAWEWYYHKIGNGNCPIVDTWWQTETGGHMITPLPYASALKPGSASQPFFGIEPQVVNEKGEVFYSARNPIVTICISFYTITCKILTWKSRKICLHKTLMIVIKCAHLSWPRAC
jgi:acetyl-CoA synthetase